jgi:hypothetical protein
MVNPALAPGRLRGNRSGACHQREEAKALRNRMWRGATTFFAGYDCIELTASRLFFVTGVMRKKGPVATPLLFGASMKFRRIDDQCGISSAVCQLHLVTIRELRVKGFTGTAAFGTSGKASPE